MNALAVVVFVVIVVVVVVVVFVVVAEVDDTDVVLRAVPTQTKNYISLKI